MTSEQAINPVIIRKYANRRLYDTSTSKYVTINNLAKMVKDGIDFRVIDVTSGQDLTRFSLVQIILEIHLKQGLPYLGGKVLLIQNLLHLNYHRM